MGFNSAFKGLIGHGKHGTLMCCCCCCLPQMKVRTLLVLNEFY